MITWSRTRTSYRATLVLVRHKARGKLFFARRLPWPIPRERAWFRPRWWGGESIYHEHEIERVDYPWPWRLDDYLRQLRHKRRKAKRARKAFRQGTGG
jgi:hypothetical protein